MKTRTLAFIIMIIACMACAAVAAPQKVNFQGKLTDAAGNQVNASVSMTFNIYDVAGGGTALWTETQTVTVTNGAYNVMLGQVNPIDTELTEIKPYWLGVKVGADAEMSPRVELTPGVYDLIMLNTLTIKNGNVGIERTNPIEKLAVNGNIEIPNGGPSGIKNQHGRYILQTGWSSKFNADYTAINSGYDWETGDEPCSVAVTGKSILFFRGNPTTHDPFYSEMARFHWNGNFGIGTSTPSHKLDVNGTLHVSGADLAEPFDMTDITSLELGDVVVIDEQNPRHVRKSDSGYDRLVAGIVSSSEQAGYVAGSRSDGSSDKPVALVGRVQCKVSAENGPIQIGDLLTTSNKSGHAMKATDFKRSQGAVLGKALEAFDGDTGMIMVLVALQ